MPETAVVTVDRHRPALELPRLPLGDLPDRAARLWPERTALRLGGQTLTFAELARRTDRCAAALDRVAAPGSTVAVATVLAPVFAVLHYGAARAGHTVVTLNPLIRGEGLCHVLAASRSRVAFLTREMYERLAPLRTRLPDLTTVVLIDGDGDGTPPAGTRTLDELLAEADGPAGASWRPASPDPDTTACLHFTSGTTGAPKAVRLSHRALAANAAQTAQAQGLDHTSVTLNQLPLFHLMHLNSALWAGAGQVLCPDPDPAAAVAAADEHGATHWFSIPMRLIRLAADPRLPGLKPRTVRGVFCGGSALPARPAAVLAEALGVPVIQGYGLAEAAPTVTLDLPDAPRPGSCGPPVAGTEVRIVDIDSRAVLAAGARGEIQIRGPQLMDGYLGQDPAELFDADGWFTTGDVGHLDTEGRLHLSDRLGSVFKCDHEIVAPAEVESVLATHPAVRDCVVFDHPDEFSGAVPHALVVLREDAGTADPSAVADAVNRDLAPFQRIRYIDAVDAIPRSPNGKVQRRLLRDRTLAPQHP